MAKGTSTGRSLDLGQAEWLRCSETQAVFAALAAAGSEARAVGGAVRDALMGKPVREVDLATPARPDAVMAAVTRAGLQAIPTGLKHGTVTVISGGRPYEVTTLRTDVETFGRHATVAFTDDWAADAQRRDFTFNALYCGADGTVYDPLGGYGDLAARRVRFVGGARERIREDYLRILRFFRFGAQVADGVLEAEPLGACVAEREGLGGLSAERVWSELKRLLVAPAMGPVLETMQSNGLLTGILGVAPRVRHGTHLVAVEAALGVPASAALRLAAIGMSVDEDASRLQTRLRLSHAETAVLHRAVSEDVRDVHPDMEPRDAQRRLYKLGDHYAEAVRLAWARSAAPVSSHDWLRLSGLPDRWPVPVFPLTGQDILALGFPSGPKIGRLLEEMAAWWLQHDFQPDRAKLLDELKRRAADA